MSFAWWNRDTHEIVDPAQQDFDIYVKQIGAPGPPMPLVTGPADDRLPEWSPDDRWIAFLRRQPQQKNQAVLLISPLGGPVQKLAEVLGVMGMRCMPMRSGWCSARLTPRTVQPLRPSGANGRTPPADKLSRGR